MAIKFKVQERKNPITRVVKFYPSVVIGSRVTLDRIVREIEESCTVHEADVRAVIASFTRRVVSHLQDGNSVSLGDLGNFRVSLSGHGSDTPEEVSAASVKRTRVVFTPSGVMRRSMKKGADGVRVVKVTDAAKAPDASGAGS